MFLRTCSSALCMFPPEPDMPMDITIPLYLSKEEFVFTTTSAVQKSVRSSCLRFQHSNCVNKTEPEDGAVTTKEKKKKKRVTFADHKGLSLTKVKVFSKFTDPIEIPVNIQEMLSSKLTLSSTEEDKLVLDFTQPSSDYLLFRQNLEQNLVSLEHCVLKEKAFAGTVKVKNLSFEKSVLLRVTFDSWKSHTDVGCEYVKDTYPTSYSDTFSFEVSLPAEMRPNERVEFAVCYKVNGKEHWDSNQGKNYHIVWSYMKKNRHSESSHFGMHFDRYGSPTCSHGLFPDWPSYAGYENIGPYY
ncbi:protein phosphatase 1 regulatory subunit 3B [Cyprinodon tularosa]|uniref:Protein phosphatase 1 regulatory subunit n=1 Tax=Cyprinodon variegatus TaxID=28743 RepID=A0A3Q2CZZ2_CYPVA|nr:PREDICTED: protein phosphatase 1 regulatory subunit 3B isoform X2 [Cyprinodon variegatus]XP_038136578.1 protein phosphatase 1 regulatory subunit 3B [Cyprinodon tularosa]